MQHDFTEADQRWMRLAIEVAQQGEGYVEPNPMVGCVIVSNNRPNEPIGVGYHAAFGKQHAERAALADAVSRGFRDVQQGSTAYVSLEPCCHFGKTPPCTDALIEAGIGRVVVAQLDPFEQVSGKGCQTLRDAGISVDVGLEEARAHVLNAPYRKRILSARPWVIAKWAMSLDGKIATWTGNSQWISSDLSRDHVHKLRSRVDAILVGSETALEDDPRLTARCRSDASQTPGVKVAPKRLALRVVADSRLRLKTESQLVKTAKQIPTLVWTGPDANSEKLAALRDCGVNVMQCTQRDPAQRLDALLAYLSGECAVTNLLVEGGGHLLGSLLELEQIDQCEVFVAPKLIGGRDARTPIAGAGFETVSKATQFETVASRMSGADTWITSRRRV